MCQDPDDALPRRRRRRRRRRSRIRKSLDREFS